MAYDEALASRLREYIQDQAHVSEKRMFGGLAFLVDGNMAVSASSQGGLLVRVTPADTDILAGEPHVRRAVMGGREMTGWLRVDASGVETDDQLECWISRCVRYARTLPPK